MQYKGGITSTANMESRGIRHLEFMIATQNAFALQRMGPNGRGWKSQRQVRRMKESSPFASAVERVNLIDEEDDETLASSDSSAFDRVPTSHHEDRRAKENQKQHRDRE